MQKVVDDCTLCDMCFMVSCPYVPPHDLDIDFPHLIARYKATELAKANNKVPKIANTDSEEFVWPNENEKVPVEENISRQLSFRKDSSLQKMLARVDTLAKISSPFSSLVNSMLEPQTLFRKLLQSTAGIDERARLPSYVSPSKQLSTGLYNLLWYTLISQRSERSSTR